MYVYYFITNYGVITSALPSFDTSLLQSNRLYWDYITECSEGYGAPSSSTYNFGVITGEEEEFAQDSSTIDQEEFCGRLTTLESHMDEGYEEYEGTVFTSSHECVCSELDADDKSFEVDCIMGGIDEDDVFFEYSEQIVFGLNQGEYKLSETSWSYSWEFNDTYGYLDYQEVLEFDNGVLTSCEVENCTSCTVCGDEESIAIDCLESSDYTVECNDNYTGTIAHLFDFGVIRETSSST